MIEIFSVRIGSIWWFKYFISSRWDCLIIANIRAEGEPDLKDWRKKVVRDLSKQFWCLVDGTNNSNLLIEFFKLNLHKILFILKHIGNLHSEYISLLGFFYFKLFICPPNVKRPKYFRDFTPWNPTRALSCTSRHLTAPQRPPLAFYNNQKPKICSKMSFSKTAWINAWVVEWFIDKSYVLYRYFDFKFQNMVGCE